MQEELDMSKLSPAAIEYLSGVAQRAARAGHGEKGRIYEEACRFLNVTTATLHRYLNQVSVRPQRKRRSDRGVHSLTLAEAEQLSAYLLPHYRGNGKCGTWLKDALDVLRKNGIVKAERVVASTGEVVPLSASAVAAALRRYGLHPEQLRRPSVAVQQASLHPNHTWQMDASTCVLFYLDDQGAAEMPESVFYKNKLENFQKVAKQRVTRFVITDHTSGAIKVRYYLGGESQKNFSEFFLWAMSKPEGLADPMHGVPFNLMVDPGSGMAGAFKNLARRLNINMIVNQPGNPRAKGQVENAQNLVEMGFESQFRAHPPRSLAELNKRAQDWCINFNARAKHSRHGMTRYQKWCEIGQQELRLLPALEICRELMTADTKPCKVDNFNQVQFGGGNRRWDVSSVPGVAPGQTLHMTWNAYNDREIFAVFHDAAGMEVLHACPLVEQMAHGFQAGARVIGEEYRAVADTDAEKARKRARMIATGTQNLQEAEAAQKRRTELMNGRVRFEHIAQENERLPVPMPKAAVPLELTAHAPSTAPMRVLNLFEAAKELLNRGVRMDGAVHALVRQQHPDGVPECELDALAQRLKTRGTLQVVAGGVR